MEYGDYSCFMGSGSQTLRYLNAPHLSQMTFLATAYPEKSQEIAGGNYIVSALEPEAVSTSMYPQILRVLKANTSEYYYLSLRRPIGFDTSLSTTYTAGLAIHRYRGTGGVQTALITTLAPGQTFSDSANGIFITAGSFSSSMNEIAVSVGSTPTASCISTTPSLTLSSSRVLAAPNSASTVRWTLRNNDSSSCSATSFQIAGSFPAGVVTNFGTRTVALNPGASFSADFTVSASSGSYNISLNGLDVDGSEPSHLGMNVAFTFEIDSTGPSTPLGFSATGGRNAIALSWSASTDNLSGVSRYEVYRDGVFLANSTSTSYSDSSATAGVTYSYYVVAVDGVGNRSLISNTSSAAATGKGRRR